ncbi:MULTISPECIES: hypothetical protein [unclassified Pseudoalteromonas]|uniref:hypothetical protein n=1 Tax=unclassified Pseudoalteromonas TaxID=194690 RepID=UPI00390CD849|nr:hypothetical protein [Ningiella sp. W23]
MDIDSHLVQLEKNNRKLFSGFHYLGLTLAMAVIVLLLMFYFSPLIGLACSGFAAFFLNFFYSQYTFRKLNARITLLQTKIEQTSK